MVDVNLFVRVLGTMTQSLCRNLITWQESCVEIYFVHLPMSGPFTTTVIYVVWQGQAPKSPCSCLNGMECCISVCMCSCQLHMQSWVDLQGQIEEREQLIVEATNISALSGPSRSDRRWEQLIIEATNNSALSETSRSDRRTRAINCGSNQPISQASCMSQYANNHIQRRKQARLMSKGSNSATVVQVLFYPL